MGVVRIVLIIKLKERNVEWKYWGRLEWWGFTRQKTKQTQS